MKNINDKLSSVIIEHPLHREIVDFTVSDNTPHLKTLRLPTSADNEDDSDSDNDDMFNNQ